MSRELAGSDVAFASLLEQLLEEHQKVVNENTRLRSLLRGTDVTFTDDDDVVVMGARTTGVAGGVGSIALRKPRSSAEIEGSLANGVPHCVKSTFGAWSKLTRRIRAARGCALRDAWSRKSEYYYGQCESVGSQRRTGRDSLGRRLSQTTEGHRKFGPSHLMLHPSGTPRVCWDIFGAMLLCWDMIMIPLQAFRMPTTGVILFMDWFTLLFWTGDMLASCMTGYVHQGTTIMRPTYIWLHYVKTWLALDLVVLVPEWVVLASGNEQSGGSTSRLFRAMRTFRVARLLRLAKFKRIVTMIRDRIDSEVTFITMNVFKLIMMLLLVNHFLASGWYFIGDTTKGESMPNWIESDQHFAEQSLGYRYTTSLHWSLTQFTPASMSVQPQNVVERTFAITVLVFGLVLFSSFVSAITASMTQLSKMQDDKSKQFWLLRRFLRQHNVDKELSFKVLRYVEYACRETDEMVSESRVHVLRLLSDQLGNELQYVVSFSCMQVHPLFAQANDLSNMGMKQLSHTALTQKSLALGDVLLNRGMKGNHMYIMVSGQLRYGKGEDAHDRDLEDISGADVLRQNDWVSEQTLWVDWLHVGSAVSISECKMVCIEARSFAEVIAKDVPSFLFISQYARSFSLWLGSQPSSDWSDAFFHKTMVGELSRLLLDEDQRSRDLEDVLKESPELGRSLQVCTDSLSPQQVQPLSVVPEGGSQLLPAAETEAKEAKSFESEGTCRL